MVYCAECGAENEEGVRYCTKCGAPLAEDVPRVVYPRRRGEKEEKAEKDEKTEKHEKEEFEEKTETSARNWVALFGFLIILAGVISLLDVWYGFWWASWDRLWPVLVIAFGLFIIWSVLRARERSPRP
ncbi:MAG: zinc ribbon domain-containing protein [Candidatus Bathyarchaeota archaeon]|nr:MAG: zinc ribbon domain-containing protein [Candidatus Bathyarchaeota archaeon]